MLNIFINVMLCEMKVNWRDEKGQLKPWKLDQGSYL